MDEHPDNQRFLTALERVMRATVPSTPLPEIDELPVAQFRCLLVLWHHPGLKMVEMAEKLSIKLPALSQLVDRLEKRGFIERVTDPDDRRVIRPELTLKVQTLLASHHEERSKRIERALERLLSDEAETLIESLGVFANALEQELPKPANLADRYEDDRKPYTKL